MNIISKPQKVLFCLTSFGGFCTIGVRSSNKLSIACLKCPLVGDLKNVILKN